MIKQTAAASACFLLAAYPAIAADLPKVPVKAVVQSADSVWTTSFNLDMRYTAWQSDRGVPNIVAPLNGGRGSGSQFYMPFGIATTGTPIPDWKFELLARTGYVRSKQTTPGLSGEVSTLTDTTLSGTATYTGFAGIIPFVSLNVNAPTGKAALYGASRFARMDPDLVDIALFGEGWNIGPTIGVNIPITAALVANLSVGKTIRHPFDKEGAIDVVTLAQPTDRISPGNVTTYNAGLTYGEGQWSASAAIAYAIEDTTSLNGAPQYKAGDRATFTGSLGYKWDDNWSTTASGFVTFSESNELFNAAIGGFQREAFNSNNTLYRIGVDHTWTDGVWSLGPTVSFLDRRKNAYDPTVFAFIPAKTRWSAGLVGGHTYSNQVSFSARVERIWANERELPAGAVPAISSTAWLVTAGAVVNF